MVPNAVVWRRRTTIQGSRCTSNTHHVVCGHTSHPQPGEVECPTRYGNHQIIQSGVHHYATGYGEDAYPQWSWNPQQHFCEVPTRWNIHVHRFLNCSKTKDPPYSSSIPTSSSRCSIRVWSPRCRKLCSQDPHSNPWNPTSMRWVGWHSNYSWTPK